MSLAWKTASRWDEVARLTLKNFVHMSKEELIIAWSTPHNTEDCGLKTAYRDRDQLRFYTAIRDDEDLTPMVQMLLNAVPGAKGKLFPWTTRDIEEVLKKFPLPAEMKAMFEGNKEKFYPHFTAHSIKQGAMAVVLRNIAEKKLDKEALAMIGKHKNPLESMPGVSVGYTRLDPNLARANGTQEITILL